MPGNVSAMSRSSVSDAGAAPQDSTRSSQFARVGPLRGADRLPLRGHQEDAGDLLGLQDVEQRAGIERAERVEHRRACRAAGR